MLGNQLGHFILMCELRDGPFILESLGSEWGLFLLSHCTGVPRWAPLIFRVLSSELDIYPDSWGILDQTWVSSLILDVPGPRTRNTSSSSGCWDLIRAGLPYSFLDCWAQSWVPSLILRVSGLRSSPIISLDLPPASSRSPKPVDDPGGLQLIPPITLSCWCGWTDR